MNEWRFEVPGPPLPWARARRNGKRTFTAPEQTAYRERIIWFAKQAKVPVFTGPICLQVYAFIAHRKHPWLAGSGDGDNYMKQVQDALQDHCFLDDACITTWGGSKQVDKVNPRLVVILSGSLLAYESNPPRSPTATRCALRGMHLVPSYVKASH